MKLTARRTKAALRLAWTRAPRAASYLVTVAQGGQTLVRSVLTARSATLAHPPAGVLVVSVQARDRNGRPGRAVTKRLR